MTIGVLSPSFSILDVLMDDKSYGSSDKKNSIKIMSIDLPYGKRLIAFI